MASKQETKEEKAEKVESESTEPAKKEAEKEETTAKEDEGDKKEETATQETKEDSDDNDDDDKEDDDDNDKGDDGKSKRVYVGNLAWEVSWQDLKDLFKTTGHEITRADVMQTPDGRSKGCGIVEFETSEGAKQAILTLNDTELMGRQIFVREDREGNNSSSSNNNNSKKQNSASNNFSSGEQAQGRRVYVGNLSWDVAWPELKDHMRTAGNVVHAEVICEHNGRSKGCGIVEYASEQEAQVAIETLTHSELNGRTIFVREDRENSSNPAASNDRPKGGSKDGGGQGSNTSVYIWNLSYDTTWQQLKDHCRKTGNVDQATVLTNADGNSIGCGIVVYQKAQDAARAIRELQETDLNGRDMKLREDRVQSGGGRGGRGGGRGGRGGRSFGGRGGGGRGGGGRGHRGPPPAEGTQLFVTNLSSGMTWQKLKDHFKTVGDVERANVKMGPDGPKFGTVRFFKQQDASKAIDELNGVDLDGSPLEIRLDHKA